jgi:uncharacterized membrane protein YhaH (DUF805 family)
MNGYLATWKKFLTLSGRASRKEYWVFTSINILIVMIFYAFIGGAVFLGSANKTEMSTASMIPAALMIFFQIASFFPSIGVMARRLHDSGRSGWWWLIVLIPLVGPIWFIVLMVLDSQPGTNKYGDHPYTNEGGAGRIQTV